MLLNFLSAFAKRFDSGNSLTPGRDTSPGVLRGHVALTVSTDASSFRWAAVIHHASGDEEIGDFWEEPVQGEHINVKEFRAVERALACLPQQVRGVVWIFIQIIKQ